MNKIESFRVEEAVEILTRTPATLRSLLSGLGPGWTRSDYGEDTFSPFDVVGHLIHGERTDWIPRARVILEHGERRPFDPFDRFAMRRESRGKTIEDLLDDFQALREANLAALRGMELSQADLARTGTHPELGRVTLGELLATWAVHDLNHIGQICKAMSHQYRNFVGPWTPYLGILGG